MRSVVFASTEGLAGTSPVRAGYFVIPLESAGPA
jgi:hypothetical protein